LFRQDNASKTGKQQRGPVHDGGPPAAQVISNIGLLSQLLTLHSIVMINQRDWEMEVLVLLDGSDPSMSATVSVWLGSGVSNGKYPDACTMCKQAYKILIFSKLYYNILSMSKFAVK
jgi:hypothetical protein